MIVKLHKNQLDYFRRKARNNPNEIMAWLVGKQIHKGLIEVYQFKYPVLIESTPNHLRSADESDKEIAQNAKDEGLILVGTIHSHPNGLPVMSPCDLSEHRKYEERVSGIVQVINRKTQVVFWRDGTPLPCEFSYF